MKKISYVMLGIIIGIVIATAPTTIAATQDVMAKFSSFNFVVNGEIKQIDADPLVYQGSTYLPVRALASSLGYQVAFNNKNKTIVLDNGNKTIDVNSSSIIRNDGNFNVYNFEDVEYILLKDAHDYIQLTSPNDGYRFTYIDESYHFTKGANTDDRKILVNNIPTKIIGDNNYLEYEFFINKMKLIVD